jgi:hypothetical protein
MSDSNYSNWLKRVMPFEAQGKQTLPLQIQPEIFVVAPHD